jgi:hypothetical protein
MCEVLRRLLDSECFYHTYADIAKGASESEDRVFANEVKALKDYLERQIRAHEIN